MANKSLVAVINAGGKGTRLSSICKDIPKPMAEICGTPILQHQIESLKKSNILEIYIIIGHLGNVISDYFKDGSRFGVKIRYIVENEPLGSGGGLFFLKERICGDFVFAFGDLMLDVDFLRMLDFHRKNKASITLFTHPNSHPFDSDLIVCDANDKVQYIDSKNNKRHYYFDNLVNSGLYIVNSSVFCYFDHLRKMDFEKDIVLKEIEAGNVFSYRSTEYVKDAGTPERYYQVEKDTSKGIPQAKRLSEKQKAVFFDRDGTINKYKGFIRDEKDIELEDGVIDTIKALNSSPYLSIVITNQPVIARGEVSFEKLNQINYKIFNLLSEKGAYLDDLFFCPHHPDKGFEGEIEELKIDCNCRKPKIGLLEKAASKYNIDLSKCYFVGDSTMDIQTGINAGMKTILVNTGLKGLDGKYKVKPDYVVDNIFDIIRILQAEE